MILQDLTEAVSREQEMKEGRPKAVRFSNAKSDIQSAGTPLKAMASKHRASFDQFDDHFSHTLVTPS